jgi:hypothetical protein
MKIVSGRFDADAFAICMFTPLDGAIMISRILGNDKQVKLITDMPKREIEEIAWVFSVSHFGNPLQPHR